MKTAAIPYRVADFLKQHPPFDLMEEGDLITLAARGRVKFHEPEEYVCWQSLPHTAFIYVIQQGSVALWDEAADPPALCDMLGAGDSIGIERFNGSATSPYSVKATSEVVLYALHAADFEPLLARYPAAAQYVAAYSAVTADYQAPGERPRPDEVLLADLLRHRVLVSCEASTPIHEAARLLTESGEQSVAITAQGEFVGLLSSDDLLRWVANGAQHPEQPARAIAQAFEPADERGPMVTVAPQTTVSDCVLAMAEAGANIAALTTDGSPRSPLQAIVTTPSLTPVFGDHPITILQEISSASRIGSLRALHERARAWIFSQLTVPVALDWLASFGDLVNRRILKRLLQFSGNDRAGRLWCFYGSAGRGELLTSVCPSIAVIGEAPTALEDTFTECGYSSAKPVLGGSLAEWKTRFSDWIRDPILKQGYRARPFFDLRPVHGVDGPFRELESHIRAELAVEPVFLRVLAHDCLANLPPLTFFRDLVVEESGAQTEMFRLESSALQPLVDVARVFSLASGAALGSSTRLRFEQARRLLPAQESIFREAAETMCVVLFHQARAGLRLRSSGAELPLSILSRQDRQVLKSGFRSIHKLLEFTAPCEWLEAL